MKDYFQDLAKKYDNAMSDAISRGVADKVVAVGNLDATRTVALELGCGTGLLSAQLAPHVAELVAVDVSAAMLELMNEKIRRGDIPAAKVSAKELDLLDPALAAPLAGKFDVVVSALAYHHIHDHKGITEALFSVLKPGGKVYIVDLYDGKRSIHGNMSDEDCKTHGVSSKNGFTAETMRKFFTEAGFVNYTPHEFAVEGWGPEMPTSGHTGKTGEVREIDDETHYHVVTDLLLSVAEKPGA